MAEKLSGVTGFVTGLGVRSVHAVREVGYLAALLVESFYWLVVGFRRRQPVRMAAIFKEAMGVGVNAIPIVGLASFATGMMLAIQGIHTLRQAREAAQPQDAAVPTAEAVAPAADAPRVHLRKPGA